MIQIELFDLFGEQLARRERDQRQLIDRCAVLLFRRTQNGEVHEVDSGIGLQQVAPGALAGVRLAGHQQYAQILADAFGGDDHAIVGRRQFSRHRIEFDFDNVRARVRERHVDLVGAADFRSARFRRACLLGALSS